MVDVIAVTDDGLNLESSDDRTPIGQLLDKDEDDGGESNDMISLR